MNSVVPNCLRRRHAVALALLIAPFAAVERAQAACAPTSPVDNATRHPHRDDQQSEWDIGYGSFADTGNTINVQSGASVTGTGAGVLLHDGTINSFGTISGGFTGISAGTANVSNSGTISGA
jgi:hypothetical protein